MTAPRLVVTTNGPGELMGWVRPFLRAVYERAPDADVTVVFVPCPYATGKEPAQTRQMFPRATVVDPKAYGRFLLRKNVAGMHRAAGALQYLGGDLFHATTIARRLGLHPMTYKFTKRSYGQSFRRFFAVDPGNARQLRRDGAPPDRVRQVGNLVPDGVLYGDASHPPKPPGVGDGVVIMPGSRPNEIRFALPFFVAAARALVRMRPSTEVTFVLSPFNGDDEIRAALEAPPDPRFFGLGGHLTAGGTHIETDGCRFAVDRSGDYAAVARAQLIITIPGTKCIEAAVLGRPMLVVVPLNRPDAIVVNGLAGYLHYVPLVGRPIKSWIVRTAERRMRYVTQPNLDADRLIVPEMRGVLHPADVASNAQALLDRPEELRAMGQALAQLYAHDIGAADRMAREVLEEADLAAAAPMAAAL
ncbi:MAG TPA: hypothetical protein VEJ20_01205 [Candidatus Eremiobacteraceae bacterium]|nr:hypothetical protein [Candidatus Eremiobacteraceae bacterium]